MFHPCAWLSAYPNVQKQGIRWFQSQSQEKPSGRALSAPCSVQVTRARIVPLNIPFLQHNVRGELRILNCHSRESVTTLGPSWPIKAYRSTHTKYGYIMEGCHLI